MKGIKRTIGIAIDPLSEESPLIINQMGERLTSTGRERVMVHSSLHKTITERRPQRTENIRRNIHPALLEKKWWKEKQKDSNLGTTHSKSSYVAAGLQLSNCTTLEMRLSHWLWFRVTSVVAAFTHLAWS
jgi:hypothetical protein